ncbi:MAG: diguanylate cyclase [Gemmatimonadota bacterium]|nr:MAG: diguanylate cyclase [Gemmatimonadota bacterium]
MERTPTNARRRSLSLRALRDGWSRFWSAPDPLLLHHGESGELTVANVRLLVVGALVVFTALQLFQAPSAANRMSAYMAAAIFVIAIGLYSMTRRHLNRPWLGFVTSIVDVSLISAVLLMFTLTGRPDVAANSRLLFAVYFIAIGAMALRNDPRICALAGLLGVLQYGAVVAYADIQWDLANYPSELGAFDLTSHYGRLLLLTCAVFLSTTAVLRTERLRWLAAKDPLTLLMNRGTFDERMQAEVARAMRHGHPLSVALIDIDHFKKFNDTYGHIVGDEVLRVLGDMLTKSLRQSDLVARYGGEEFIVLFPETPSANAVYKAEDLRQTIEHSSVTVSIGVAELPADGTDTRAVIDCADQRMYQAKRAGRNRVVGSNGEATVKIEQHTASDR